MLKNICGLFGNSRQGRHYHQRHQGKKLLQQEVILWLVCQVRTELPKLVGLKLRFKLAKELELNP